MPFAPLDKSWFKLGADEVSSLEDRLTRLLRVAQTEMMSIRHVDLSFMSILGARAVALDCAFAAVAGQCHAPICTKAAAMAGCIIGDHEPIEASQTRLDLINAELAYKAMVKDEGEDERQGWAGLITPTDFRVTFRIHADPAISVYAEVAGLHPMEMSQIDATAWRLGAPLYEVPIRFGSASGQKRVAMEPILPEPEKPLH